jgi:hypothetical protein
MFAGWRRTSVVPTCNVSLNSYFLPAAPAAASSPSSTCSRFMDVRVQADPSPMPAPNPAKILRPAAPPERPPRNSTTPAKPPMTSPAPVFHAMLFIPFRIVSETTRSEVIITAACCCCCCCCCAAAAAFDDDDDDGDDDSIFFQFVVSDCTVLQILLLRVKKLWDR